MILNWIIILFAQRGDFFGTILDKPRECFWRK